MSHEPIAEQLEHDWQAFTRRLPHHHHGATMAATPAPEAAMNVITTIEQDFEKVAAEVRLFAEEKLPPVAAKIQALEGNPVADALLRAAHVPVEALDIAVRVIDGLASIYAVPAAAAAPAEAVPAEAVS
jgi:hypothetical protein